jgi:hypothetical protein
MTEVEVALRPSCGAPGEPARTGLEPGVMADVFGPVALFHGAAFARGKRKLEVFLSLDACGHDQVMERP